MIDLHAHTSRSDGSLTPSELVAYAAEIGLTAVAITDHDSVEGIAEAVEAGRRHDIEVVPGVEIPLQFEQVTLDMLGYFLCEPPSAELRAQLARLRQDRDERNTRILARLTRLGMPVTPEDLAAVARGEAVGRPHIGEALRRLGYVDSISDAFNRFLRRGAPAFVDRRRLGLAEALHLIRASNALPVVAHPGLIRTDAAGLERLVQEAVRHGLVGLECYYPTHDAATVARCLALAERYGLVATGGSDFHGDVKPNRLGVADGDHPIPDCILVELKERCP